MALQTLGFKLSRKSAQLAINCLPFLLTYFAVRTLISLVRPHDEPLQFQCSFKMHLLWLAMVPRRVYDVAMTVVIYQGFKSLNVSMCPYKSTVYQYWYNGTFVQSLLAYERGCSSDTLIK